MKMNRLYERYNQIFTFKGRLSRRDYIYSFILYVACLILNVYVLQIDFPYISLIENNPVLSNLAGLLFLILFVAYLFLVVAITIYFLCRSIQRLHDMNESGIWIIFRIFWILGAVHYIPLILAIICEIVLLLKRGTNGPNKYDWLLDADSLAGKE